MEKINNTIKVQVQIYTFLILWALVILATTSYSTVDLLVAIKQIPKAISIYVIMGIIFTRWIWRWSILQGWLIKCPDLQGTWKGVLRSDWINPETGKGIDPIPVILIVRQNFSSIKCTLMTRESTSYSTTADINVMHGGEDLYLAYSYTNRSKATIRDRSPIHDGAATLKINKKAKALEGEYWTSRKTRGEMHLEFFSKDLLESFPVEKVS